MKKLLVVVGMMLAAAMAARTDEIALPKEAPKVAGKFVVHEWGVAIRQPTTSGTMLSAPPEQVAGLPSFVIQQKSVRTLQPQGWDKPVIWFYGPDGLKVDIKVMAGKGFATACYPAAEVLTRKFIHTDVPGEMISTLTETAGFRWQGTLTKEPTGKVMPVAKDHWWQVARDAGGLYFNAGHAAERFLFYEATAFQEPTVSGVLSADTLTIRNRDDQPSGPVLILLNKGGKHYVRVVESVGANAAVEVGRSALLKEAVSAAAVLAACAAQWHGCGLTAAESKAVVQVWREDLLKADNFLLLARMPAKLYDAMFPLTIVPAPAELVRVGMVFDALHDQWDAASWVPARQDAAREAMARTVADLGSSEYRKREAATEELARHGQKARRLLEQLAQSPDPEISTRARTLLEKVPLPTVEAPASSGGNPRGVSIQSLDGER